MSSARSAATADVLPARKGRKSKKGRKSRSSSRSSSVKIREAAALEAYFHRAQLWQSPDARQQERCNLQLRKSGSSQQLLPPVLPPRAATATSGSALPPVLGVSPLMASPPSSPASASSLAASANRNALRVRLCGYLASPHAGIDCLLSVLKLDPGDTIYDLGCGDGRVVTSVVKRFGCKGVGVDLNGPLVKQAQNRASAEFADTPELLEKVSFVQEGIGKMDLGDATVVYIYMPQDALHSLCSRVLPGTGIQDGTLIYTEEYWLHDRAALRHCKWKASHWNGELHCYEWQVAYGKPERATF